MLYDISYVYNIQPGVYAETFRPSSAGRSLYSLFIFLIFLSQLLVHESLVYFFVCGELRVSLLLFRWFIFAIRLFFIGYIFVPGNKQRHVHIFIILLYKLGYFPLLYRILLSSMALEYKYAFSPCFCMSISKLDCKFSYLEAIGSAFHLRL
jgi:hypothetical protein